MSAGGRAGPTGSWTNLLADGKAKLALVVMPFGHAVSGATGKPPSVRALWESSSDEPRTKGAFGAVGFIEKDLSSNVIPLVEKAYRVFKEADERPIVGPLGGGVQASTIGLNHPEKFAFVGATSDNAREAALADPEKTNKAYKLLWLGYGTHTDVINGSRALDEVLTNEGIRLA